MCSYKGAVSSGTVREHGACAVKTSLVRSKGVCVYVARKTAEIVVLDCFGPCLVVAAATGRRQFFDAVTCKRRGPRER